MTLVLPRGLEPLRTKSTGFRKADKKFDPPANRPVYRFGTGAKKHVWRAVALELTGFDAHLGETRLNPRERRCHA
jgi:hypothetical protein